MQGGSLPRPRCRVTVALYAGSSPRGECLGDYDAMSSLQVVEANKKVERCHQGSPPQSLAEEDHRLLLPTAVPVATCLTRPGASARTAQRWQSRKRHLQFVCEMQAWAVTLRKTSLLYFSSEHKMAWCRRHCRAGKACHSGRFVSLMLDWEITVVSPNVRDSSL